VRHLRLPAPEYPGCLADPGRRPRHSHQEVPVVPVRHLRLLGPGSPAHPGSPARPEGRRERPATRPPCRRTR